MLAQNVIGLRSVAVRMSSTTWRLSLTHTTDDAVARFAHTAALATLVSNALAAAPFALAS